VVVVVSAVAAMQELVGAEVGSPGREWISCGSGDRGRRCV
jgi:hypothetical protein